MPSIGPFELIIILAVILIIFGVGKLPEVGGAVGRALREFRKAQSSEDLAAKPDPRESKKET